MEPTIISINLSGVNCYLIKQNNNFVLCDTGGHLILDKNFDNRRKELLQALEKYGCYKENLKLIILTHGDNDHVANAAFIRNTFDVPIAMHEEDLFLVNEPSLQDMCASFRYGNVILNIFAKFMMKGITKIMQKTLNEFESFYPDCFLKEGDCLKSYGIDATILHLPGHTPGSIGILTSKKELICGDVLQNNKKPGAALNAVDFKLLNKSIKRLEELDLSTIYPGHGMPFVLKAKC